jgi:hypothetical protein
MTAIRGPTAEANAMPITSEIEAPTLAEMAQKCTLF